MTETERRLVDRFPELASGPELRAALLDSGTLKSLPVGTVLLRQGGFIRGIPLLLDGLVKIFKEDESGSELLLYYIQPGESCVASMTSVFRDGDSPIKAVVEEEAEVLLLPTDRVVELAKRFPLWNTFFFSLFDQKFNQLLEAVELLTFSSMDGRLRQYLERSAELKGKRILETTHQAIADDLGTSREVVSRLLKRMEVEGQVSLGKGRIELLGH